MRPRIFQAEPSGLVSKGLTHRMIYVCVWYVFVREMNILRNREDVYYTGCSMCVWYVFVRDMNILRNREDV